LKHGFIKVISACPKIKVADCGGNAERIIEIVKTAVNEQVKIAVFPELCITGYTCGDLFFQRALQKQAETALEKICRASEGSDLLVFVGCPLVVGNKLYNTAVAMQNGNFLGVTPKRYLPNYNEFYEKRHFSVYNGETVTTKFGLFGTNIVYRAENMPEFTACAEICEDLWAVTPPSNTLAAGGANVIVNLSAGNETIGKAEYRRDLVRGQSGRLICAYVYANAGEGESTSDMVFSGHRIIAENGETIADSGLFSEEPFIAADIDLQKIQYERMKNTSFNAEGNIAFVNFTVNITETPLARKFSKTPFVPYSEEGKDKRCETIAAMQSHALKKRIEHLGTPSAVIGISGGLDSCLALLVTVKAFDLLNRKHSGIIAVTMPCFGTTKRTRTNAEKLCRTLDVTFREVDITEAVRLHFRDIGHDESLHNVVYENCQARERTQVLMDIANTENGIVIGTCDLSETALGWSTYNGDHMSMYGVNGGVPKTLVRHLVQFFMRNAKSAELEATLRDILATPISPELLPPDKNGVILQKTEEVIGPYELHDFFLYYAIRFGFPADKVLRLAKLSFAGIAETEIADRLNEFYRRFAASQFKRNCMPDTPKIGSVSLSPRADWRMPSDSVNFSGDLIG
jgi:NAD+ synthase (glutamine-hydrolysing)